MAAIPKIRAATGPEEYGAAVESMLDASHDPVTRVLEKPAPPLPEGNWKPDATYAGQEDPSPERRLLAVVRFWNVVELFCPYTHLIGDGDADERKEIRLQRGMWNRPKPGEVVRALPGTSVTSMGPGSPFRKCRPPSTSPDRWRTIPTPSTAGRP